VYHVLNRSVGRRTIFGTDGDYRAFEKVLTEAQKRTPMPLLAYSLMPNHWHFVVRPVGDGDLSRFMAWLTTTHTSRWHKSHNTVGSGHLYQGRFKSFPVQDDAYFITVCRYVEGNPLRAGLVRQAQDWPYGSLWHLIHPPGDHEGQLPQLSAWPLPRPADWAGFVNTPLNALETETLNRCARRGCPFGDSDWVDRIAATLGLQRTLRPVGRPRK